MAALTLPTVLALFAGAPPCRAAAAIPTPDQASERTPAVYAQQLGTVSALSVRPDLYLLSVSGVNVALETGPDGVMVVDTGPAAAAPALLAAIRTLTHEGPIRYLVNTSADQDRIGGDAVLAGAGEAFAPGVLGSDAPVIAHQNALLRLIDHPGEHEPAEALPSETFTRDVRSAYFNGQAVQVIWQPAAHTDGDSVVFFRRSDVLVTGALFDPRTFPVIDLAHGGSITGEIAALNFLLDRLTVAVTPLVDQPGGTLVIPGAGPLCDQADLLNYRDMVTIIRDRIAALLAHGQTLEQVQAADPTQGYASRYGAANGPASAHEFVATVYRSLQAQRAHGFAQPAASP